MRSIASTARMVSGWVTGELLAYLSENSGAARATHGMASVAPVAAPVSSRARRLVVKLMDIPPVMIAAAALRETRAGLGTFHAMMGSRPTSGKTKGDDMADVTREKQADPAERAGPVEPAAVAWRTRAALVTGGASGIGLACAERLVGGGLAGRHP